jgi:hypothetical protein
LTSDTSSARFDNAQGQPIRPLTFVSLPRSPRLRAHRSAPPAMLAATACRAVRRVAVRRALSSSEVATPGPRLPLGNDSAAFHSKAAAEADSIRWMRISVAFGIPVVAFGIVKCMAPHGKSCFAAIH